MNSEHARPERSSDVSSRIEAVGRVLLPAGPGVFHSVVGYLSGFSELSALWSDALSSGPSLGSFDRLLARLDIDVRCSDSDLARIPQTGPAILVANHPHGFLDGLVLGSVLARRRPDFRFMANGAIALFQGIEQFIIPVDVFGGSVQLNAAAARQALRWLRKGGLLVVFPAGEVSAIGGLPPFVKDREWSEAVVRIAAAAEAKLIRAFISGQNSIAFHIAGLAHSSFRTALLGRELLNKRGQAVDVILGKPLQPERHQQNSAYLRQRTYLLGGRVQRHGMRLFPPRLQGLIPAVNPRLLAQNINDLHPECKLFENGEYSAYAVRAAEIPDVLDEIGRLREITFRRVGEGSGKSSDVDRFDSEYRHLFLWNQQTREVVGAYRMGLVDRIVSRNGIQGLYTHTLFRFGKAFLNKVSPGIELGRSFVRHEYQKKAHSLYYLWRGIGVFIGRNPKYRYLFGPVSISNEYTRTSRELIVGYFRTQFSSREFGVQARRRFFQTPFHMDLFRMPAGLLTWTILPTSSRNWSPMGKGCLFFCDSTWVWEPKWWSSTWTGSSPMSLML